MLGATTRNNPFDTITRDLERMLTNAARTNQNVQTPPINAWREGDAIHLEAELPGFKMEDVEVLAGEDRLTIRGRRETNVPEGATPLHVERAAWSFERSLGLPLPIDTDKVDATLRDGVLRITLPIAEAARPRRVQVRTIAQTEDQRALPNTGASAG